jgi:putative ABC transport system permease protein
MFNLEQAIKKWKKGLAASQAMEEGYIAELESHLRDRVEELTAQGIGSEDVFQQVAAAMGKTEQIGTEFYKAHTARRSDRPPWQPPRFMPALLWNYLKVALRKLERHRIFSFITIAGMTVGLTCFVLIMTFVGFELSFDRFHEKADRIHRFTYRSLSSPATEFDTGCPDLLAPALAANITGVARAARVMESWQEKAVLMSGKRSFLEHGIYADEHFLDIFSFPLLQGDRRSALNAAGAVVLSERTAARLFGRENPLGKAIDYRERSMRYALIVSGVMKDVPRNSHLQFDYIISVATLAADPKKKFMFNNWNVGNFLTYVELLPGHAQAEVERGIARFLKNSMPGFKDDPLQVALQPLADIYLKSAIAGERNTNLRIQSVYMFISISVIILLLACLNFTILSTARALTRAKEVGLRKVVGAGRFDLVRQFIGESVLYSSLSLVLGLGLALLLLRRFAALIGIELAPRDLLGLPMVPLFLAAALFSGILAGIYPGIVLSAFKPVRAFRNFAGAGRGSSRVRNLLVVMQFFAAITLIVCTLVVFKQLHFIRSRDPGYDRERVVVIPLHDQKTRDNAAAIKNTLLGQNEVSGVTVSGSDQYPVSVRNSMGGVEVETGPGQAKKIKVRFDYVDEDFVRVMGLSLVKGRNFSRQYSTDKKGILVNEALVRLAGWKGPLGKNLDVFGTRREKDPLHVLGVVRDFNFDTVHSGIEPAVLVFQPGSLISVRLRPGDLERSLATLKKAFAKAAPGQPFDYFFLNDAFNELYRKEQKMGEMLAVFSVLAILIACLGLFGLAVFTAERRTKEIGIRKVLGASMRSVLVMLNRDFIAWVLLANLLAWPLAYFAMKSWLREFAYKIPLGLSPFLLAGLSALAIALLTVSYQAVRAARANPVDSLRYE